MNPAELMTEVFRVKAFSRGVRGVLAWVLALGITGVSTRAAVPASDGLYAVFEVKRGATAVGQFVCQLEFQKVPRTVANFVGLAEGRKVFVDYKRGHPVARPYFDGIMFHRVVPGFVIQGGSPNGQGTDGPGYTFRDEFDATLRHDRAGVLSMANSGLNSNGSQFFVTLAATPWLNDVHTVFGHVVDGMNVVTNVAQGDVIARVTVVRNGSAAAQFEAAGHGLPEVSEGKPAIAQVGEGFILGYDQPANSEVFVFCSDDLAAWAQVPGPEIHGVEPVPDVRDVSSVTVGKPQKFFVETRVDYPDSIWTPSSMAGRSVKLVDGGGFSLALTLTNGVSGRYVFTQGAVVLGPYPVLSYSWSPEAYRGRLVWSMSGLALGADPITQGSVNLVFTNAVKGTYSGDLYTGSGQTVPVKGAVTVTGP